mmetsp:Transcript_64344/g.178819  ORF Transcript_64344/g.178819 Transcript_64344/m.178819 type:complete len:247 (+) Transcript_64344:1238-1978(+)
MANKCTCKRVCTFDMRSWPAARPYSRRGGPNGFADEEGGGHATACRAYVVQRGGEGRLVHSVRAELGNRDHGILWKPEKLKTFDHPQPDIRSLSLHLVRADSVVARSRAVVWAVQHIVELLGLGRRQRHVHDARSVAGPGHGVPALGQRQSGSCGEAQRSSTLVVNALAKVESNNQCLCQARGIGPFRAPEAPTEHLVANIMSSSSVGDHKGVEWILFDHALVLNGSVLRGLKVEHVRQLGVLQRL